MQKRQKYNHIYTRYYIFLNHVILLIFSVPCPVCQCSCINMEYLYSKSAAVDYEESCFLYMTCITLFLSKNLCFVQIEIPLDLRKKLFLFQKETCTCTYCSKINGLDIGYI